MHRLQASPRVFDLCASCFTIFFLSFSSGGPFRTWAAEQRDHKTRHFSGETSSTLTPDPAEAPSFASFACLEGLEEYVKSRGPTLIKKQGRRQPILASRTTPRKCEEFPHSDEDTQSREKTVTSGFLPFHSPNEAPPAAPADDLPVSPTGRTHRDSIRSPLSRAFTVFRRFGSTKGSELGPQGSKRTIADNSDRRTKEIGGDQGIEKSSAEKLSLAGQPPPRPPHSTLHRLRARTNSGKVDVRSTPLLYAGQHRDSETKGKLAPCSRGGDESCTPRLPVNSVSLRRNHHGGKKAATSAVSEVAVMGAAEGAVGGAFERESSRTSADTPEPEVVMLRARRNKQTHKKTSYPVRGYFTGLADVFTPLYLRRQHSAPYLSTSVSVAPSPTGGVNELLTTPPSTVALPQGAEAAPPDPYVYIFDERCKQWPLRTETPLEELELIKYCLEQLKSGLHEIARQRYTPEHSYQVVVADIERLLARAAELGEQAFELDMVRPNKAPPEGT